MRTRDLAGGNQERHLRLVSHLLDSTSEVRSDGRCLEIGCGEGEITRRLVRRFRDVVAIDSTYRFARLTARRAGCNARVADEERLPFPDGTFATVTCFSLATEGPSWIGAVEEAFRVLEPGGVLVLVAPRSIPLHEIFLRASAYLALGYRGLSSSRSYVARHVRLRLHDDPRTGPTERSILKLIESLPIKGVTLHLPRRRLICNLWECGLVIEKLRVKTAAPRPAIHVCRRCLSRRPEDRRIAEDPSER